MPDSASAVGSSTSGPMNRERGRSGRPGRFASRRPRKSNGLPSDLGHPRLPAQVPRRGDSSETVRSCSRRRSAARRRREHVRRCFCDAKSRLGLGASASPASPAAARVRRNVLRDAGPERPATVSVADRQVVAKPTCRPAMTRGRAGTSPRCPLAHDDRVLRRSRRWWPTLGRRLSILFRAG